VARDGFHDLPGRELVPSAVGGGEQPLAVAEWARVQHRLHPRRGAAARQQQPARLLARRGVE
jgi:hypothetical protein